MRDQIDNGLDALFPDLETHPHLHGRVFVGSVIAIGALSWILVMAAQNIALILQIPAVLIALTVIALGTSVPDVIASLLVARK